MRGEQLEVSVTFDERRGYVGMAAELKVPVTALSLGGLRRRVEALMVPDDVHIVLHLDRAARLERDRRRQQPQLARLASVSSPRQWCCGLTWPEGFSRRVHHKTPTARGPSPGRGGKSRRSSPWGRAAGPLPRPLARAVLLACNEVRG
jgi:hypothetical protein